MATYLHTFTSGDTLTPTKLNAARTATDIVNADIKSDAAIAGTKIAPDFGSQNVVTSGEIKAESDIVAEMLVSRATADSGGGNFTALKSRGTQAAKTIVSSGDDIGTVIFSAYDGATHLRGAIIRAQVDGTPGTNDMPGRLVFGTTADGASSPTERMRINNDGDVLVGQSSTIVPGQSNTTTGHALTSDGRLFSSVSAAGAGTFNRNTSDGAVVSLRRQGTAVGSISVTAAATAYNTSSDYRLKQNVEPMVGGLAKLSALAPKTFEFINEPSVKVDGFIAHEVQAIVPQAVTGEKDGEEMQGLDHSKLVPVLVAALQELAAKVAALEAA
jgi:hypothetical protein